MTSRTPPPNLRSLEARLRHLARDHGTTERRVRRLISIVVIGQLLAVSDTAVVKGASNLEVRVGTRSTRVSSDLDTVMRHHLDSFRERFALALREGWARFSGRLVDVGPIATPGPVTYRPHRFNVKLTYDGRPFGTVTLEVSAEEIEAARHPDVVMALDAPAWFNALGLPAPSAVPLLPLNHQIAQKLHACTTPDLDDWVNDRAHDLVDLQLAARMYGDDLPDLRETAVRLFAFRRGHSWPPTATRRAGWNERYSAAAAGLDVVPDVDAGVEWTNEFIDRVEHS